MPMTSEEIKAKPAIDWSVCSWLREVAYQLALLNERHNFEMRKPPKPAQKVN